jgi:hypothetical protein
VAKTDTGGPALDSKVAIPIYKDTLKPRSREMFFITSLEEKRKRDTAVTYMDSYRRFWKQIRGKDDWYVLHPVLKPTGTDTLRWSSSNPNSQNISKKEGFNLRFAFGPAPGREWWSLDAKNIELRIPAYESNETEMIALFEKPNDPPYYGSNHLLNFHTVYLDLWERELKEVGIEKVGPHCKKKYASSWYQWCKNGGFAKIYGGQKATVDRSFHKEGAYELIAQRFSKMEALNQHCIYTANKQGYVETMVDKTIGSKRGYPIWCTRTQWGKVLPTVPLNYHVQSTAMWWTMKAMIRTQEQLDQWNRQGGDNYFLCMQVHDECVFDFPLSETDPTKDNAKGYGPSNRWRIELIKKHMEEGGNDIGIPTPVGVEYHSHNWSEGIVVY